MSFTTTIDYYGSNLEIVDDNERHMSIYYYGSKLKTQITKVFIAILFLSLKYYLLIYPRLTNMS